MSAGVKCRALSGRASLSQGTQSTDRPAEAPLRHEPAAVGVLGELHPADLNVSAETEPRRRLPSAVELDDIAGLDAANGVAHTPTGSPFAPRDSSVNTLSPLTQDRGLADGRLAPDGEAAGDGLAEPGDAWASPDGERPTTCDGPAVQALVTDSKATVAEMRIQRCIGDLGRRRSRQG